MNNLLQTRPLPSLQETLNNYLVNVEPLLEDADFDRTSRLCAQFLSGPGPELHDMLLEIEADAEQPNWNAGFWDRMYLTFRDPLPIHSSPFFAVCDQAVLNDLPLEEVASRVIYATNAVIKAIRDGSFAPEFSKGVAQDMVQYQRFFGYARNPVLHRDEAGFDSSANSVCVLYRNRIFILDVLRPGGRSVSVEELRSNIGEIIQRADKPEETSHFVGYFTTDERNEWALKKEELAYLCPGNREALEKIDASLYVLCLDEGPVADLNDRARKLLHNEGRNRFFDKYQIVIFGDGKIGSIFEHAPVDAISVGRIWNETIKHLLNPTPCERANEQHQQKPKDVSELVFELTPDIRKDIELSRHKFRELARRTQQETLEFREFGTIEVKKLGMSPDACVQLLLQLSYFNAFGDIDNVYESVSTRQFSEGRTDVLRPVTQQSLDFIRSVKTFSKAEALGQFKQAVQSIVERRRISSAGRAPDHHLSALSQLAQIKRNSCHNYEEPALFRDSAYQTYSRSVLSTSNISDPLCRLFGFGPVTPDGLGIAYGTYPDHFIFHLSFFDDNRSRIARFVRELEGSLQYLKALM